MSYTLLIKKLRLDEGRFVVAPRLMEYCRALKLDYYAAIGYLLHNRYLLRILRGIFYKVSVEERLGGSVPSDFYGIFSEALKIRGVKHWYIGLESALPLNNVMHEYVAVDDVITDILFRAKPFTIMGRNVKFSKTLPKFFSFGIISKPVPHSDIEKTVLDLIYFGKYNNKSDATIKHDVSEYVEHCNASKLKRYAKHYPKTVQSLVEELL